MALSVVSRTGKPVRRCGITFTDKPVIVSDDTLENEFGVDRVVIGQYLKRDPLLKCEIIKPEPAKAPKKPE